MKDHPVWFKAHSVSSLPHRIFTQDLLKLPFHFQSLVCFCQWEDTILLASPVQPAILLLSANTASCGLW